MRKNDQNQIFMIANQIITKDGKIHENFIY
jgi:hypothetical protein